MAYDDKNDERSVCFYFSSNKQNWVWHKFVNMFCYCKHCDMKCDILTTVKQHEANCPHSKFLSASKCYFSCIPLLLDTEHQSVYRFTWYREAGRIHRLTIFLNQLKSLQFLFKTRNLEELTCKYRLHSFKLSKPTNEQ